MRAITVGVDPELQLREVRPLDQVYEQGQRALSRLTALMFALITLCVVLLSAAGMYALMSFTVTRQRREIGIRSALGAQPRRLVMSVLARALRQLGLGALLGAGAAAVLQRLSYGEFMAGHAVIVLPVVLAIMTVTGGVAAFGPARRSLRIQPASALRAE
ncbi:MAG TPA: FtsX-like permease family protein [Gemmatimonadaceae bacterium]